MVEPPFFQKNVVHISMLVAIVRQKDEIIFCTFSAKYDVQNPSSFFLSFL